LFVPTGRIDGESDAQTATVTPAGCFAEHPASVVRGSKFGAAVASNLKTRIILIVANGFAITLGADA
jgi:hypothetical protein